VGQGSDSGHGHGGMYSPEGTRHSVCVRSDLGNSHRQLKDMCGVRDLSRKPLWGFNFLKTCVCERELFMYYCPERQKE
jgi:hypothetical protein